MSHAKHINKCHTWIRRVTCTFKQLHSTNTRRRHLHLQQCCGKEIQCLCEFARQLVSLTRSSYLSIYLYIYTCISVRDLHNGYIYIYTWYIYIYTQYSNISHLFVYITHLHTILRRPTLDLFVYITHLHTQYLDISHLCVYITDIHTQNLHVPHSIYLCISQMYTPNTETSHIYLCRLTHTQITRPTFYLFVYVPYLRTQHSNVSYLFAYITHLHTHYLHVPRSIYVYTSHIYTHNT